MAKDKSKSGGRPWRDNIEAITVSIITIVLFKYFVLEAYKIPTGSMQPTLMGNPETGIFDRVLVDKFSPHVRDLERYEVVVFKYPLNRAQNFIKRIVGMPGEELEIRDGDLFRRPIDDTGAPTGDWEVLRRSRSVQASQLRRLDTTGEWAMASPKWNEDAGSIVADGPGRASFPRTSTSIRDGYTDGYPEALIDRIDTRNKRNNGNQVSDVRVTTTVRAESSTEEVRIELREGGRRFRFVLPGPAAKSDARARIEAIDPTGGMSPAEVATDADWRLPAGKGIDVFVQNLDDLLEFEVEGLEPLRLEVPPAGQARQSQVALATVGGGGTFGDVEVQRDIFYTTAGQHVTRWTIGADQYVMLGDNSQDSSDGRDWRLKGMRILEGDGAGELVYGNFRPNDNPRYVGDGNDRTVYFRDELGELRVFRESQVEELDLVPAPLVSRESIVGRAVLVVWPLSPTNGVYRVKWVR